MSFGVKFIRPVAGSMSKRCVLSEKVVFWSMSCTASTSQVYRKPTYAVLLHEWFIAGGALTHISTLAVATDAAPVASFVLINTYPSAVIDKKRIMPAKTAIALFEFHLIFALFQSQFLEYYLYDARVFSKLSVRRSSGRYWHFLYL